MFPNSEQWGESIMTTKKTTSTSSRAKRTTTAKKTTTARKTVAASKAKPVVVTESAPVVSGPELKKVDLIEKVVERSDVKKRYAKPSIEAALQVLGEALAEGRPLNLPGFGKLKVQKVKDVANGKVMNVRIRQPKIKADAPKEGVAEAAE